jgi:alpha-L-arabinofuranosidase
MSEAMITVDVMSPAHEVSPHLFGVFFEEINYAGVGGLYAEKIQNRAFMDRRTPPTWPAPLVTRCEGRFGKGISLNGQTSTTKVALPEGIANGLTDFTIAAWVRPTTIQPFNKVFDFGSDLTGIFFYNTSGAHMSMALASPFYISPLAGPGPSYVISIDGKKEELHSPDPLPLGEWSHLAITQSGAIGRLYVNGRVAAQNTQMTLTPSLMGPTKNNWLGASQFAFDPPLDGSIDEFQIFSRALDQASVRSLMDTPGGTVEDERVAWYRFDEDGGLAVLDSSGAGQHATVIEQASAWQLINEDGFANAAIDENQPLNAALTRSLRLDIARVGAGKRVGMANTGYFGVPAVAGEIYRVSFWAKATRDLSAPLTVSVEKADGSRSLAVAQVSGVTTEWKRFESTLTISTDAGETTDNRFVIGVDLRQAGNTGVEDLSLWLQVVSLFAPTYANRENGLRRDLVQRLKELRPRFCRFPGGTYILGNTLETRFDWKASRGPIWQRPGHDNDVWRYWSDDGLGILEYLQLAEDLNATPLIGIYPGLSGGVPVPEEDLGRYVQDALDLIEYATGPITSPWGAKRADDGHPEPFELPIIEIGNEDFLGAGDSYALYRYPMFYDAIKAAYPDVRTIATMPVPEHPVEILDEHMYRSPEEITERSARYDKVDRDGSQILVGEYAVITTAANNATADLEAALAESAFMTGLERNSDVVALSCYAPLFAFDGENQWNPNLIGFDQLTSYASPSYWAQQLFAANIGDRYLPTACTDDELHCSATIDTVDTTTFLKVVNTTSKARTVELRFVGSDSTVAATQVLTGNPADRNSLVHPDLIAPIPGTLAGTDGTFSYDVPAHSATVITCRP